MKKIATLFFFLVLFLLSRTKEVVVPTFEEIISSSPSYCYLSFEKGELHTKNFENFFAEETVLSIWPYIKEAYQKNMKKIEKYTFTSDTHIHNLSLFEKLYKENLYDSGFLSDIAKIEVYGIPIREVKVLCNSNHFFDLKKHFPKIKVRNM